MHSLEYIISNIPFDKLESDIQESKDSLEFLESRSLNKMHCRYLKRRIKLVEERIIEKEFEEHHGIRTVNKYL